jgi:glycosyltransferase involved in cell wall biosynthesis
MIQPEIIRLAFVVPRYGEEILGGAETITRHLVERLPRSEFDARVLTTCASDMITWENVYPAGPSQIGGIPVLRFPIDHHLRDKHRHWELMLKFTNNWPLSVDEEYEWIEHSAHSPALYAYIAQQGQAYHLLIFGPYLFGTTFYGTTLRPDQTVLWPHLHDEPFAHFAETRLMMESCRGIMFNSQPEMALAQERLGIHNPRSFVVGEGLEQTRAEPARFRQQSGMHDPFVLYAGRWDEAKNLMMLLSFFIEYKRQRPGTLKLVLMGGGPLPIPDHPDILPIGFQSEERKQDVYAAATVLCQPSLQESFSLVIMESWLVGVPVMVHGHCPVTRYHVLQSNGGLYFTSASEFAAVVDWFLDHPQQRRQMGFLGQAYVHREFNWPTVLDRFRESLRVWLG